MKHSLGTISDRRDDLARGPNRVYIGFVTAIDGTTPGPASGISYTVRINKDGSVLEVPRVVPSNGRLPDEWDVDAFPIGTLVLVINESGRLEFVFCPAERPATGVCPGG